MTSADHKAFIKALRRDFHYDPETGHFYNRIWDPELTRPVDYFSSNHNRRIVNVQGRAFSVWRLGWIYVNKKMPSRQEVFVPKNGNYDDGRFENIAKTTRSRTLVGIPRGDIPMSGQRGVVKIKERVYSGIVTVDGVKYQLDRRRSAKTARKDYMERVNEVRPYPLPF